MKESSNKESGISRRSALKVMGLGAAALAVGTFAKAADARGTFYDNLQAKAAAGEITPVDKKLNYKNGDKISVLGFGCMRFPTTGAGRNAPVDVAATQKLVDYAYEHGINYYDTAYVYHGGKSEGIIGEALKKYPRGSYFLADKMPGYLVKQKSDIASFFEVQLKRCNVDYFDYYLLHSITQKAEYDKVYEEFGGYEYCAEQKRKGRIKNLGFSFHGDRALWDYIIDKHPWDFVQIQLNYIDWRADGEYLYKSLEERKIPCIVMEPLLGGRLASLSAGANQILKEKNPEASIASWAFRWVGSLPNVLAVLSGMTYMSHLEDNVRTYTDFKKLSAAENAVLGRAVSEYQKFSRIGCTACRYCMPCPFEVEIPSVFDTYNKLVMEGNIPDKASQSAEEYASKKNIFTDAFRKAFAEGGSADACVACGECIQKCPQHLQIPDLMAMIKGV